jgi:type IV pilus biogenesis protein CpaD/CtpE
MRGQFMRRVAVAGVVLALAGCADTDPYMKPGRWQPTGANAVNLATMVQRPADLIRGRGAAGTVGLEATSPVSRLWSGKPTPLPAVGSQDASSGPAQQAPGGAN